MSCTTLQSSRHVEETALKGLVAKEGPRGTGIGEAQRKKEQPQGIQKQA